MEWVSRLLGLPSAPKKPAARRPQAYDPETRLAKFKRIYHTVLALCNRPRNLANEGPLLQQLNACLERIAAYIREETRAPAPHLCLQFASANSIYALVSRAAIVSHHAGIVHSAVTVFAALVDSEEEEFLSSGPFAKSLMRLATRVVDNGTDQDTETAILELLFTVAAKIRLEPEILGVWFQNSIKSESNDVFVKGQKLFVGTTQKDDFPLCYILIDRVHLEGRIGDFARTGLLYIFEATGRSLDLETWVVSSDLPTLMASGLGALYSQLSRELSILHPDATLPAVLAMSDYSTTHARATAESAFSERHQIHMATFLSYLAFWQDVLDHCRSNDVRQTLLDHFQILFLQQLLYPSLLQSSDTDAGSSVAVLTYLNAMLESLDYPDLMHMILDYLLAISDQTKLPEAPSRRKSLKSPPSPTAARRRQSLILLTAPTDPDGAVEPALFNLVDLILNNVSSRNSQSVFASLRLASTLLTRQKRYVFGTLLKVQESTEPDLQRTAGGLNLEVHKLIEIALSYHDHRGLDEAFAQLCDDTRLALEMQLTSNAPSHDEVREKDDKFMRDESGRYILQPDDPLLKTCRELLHSFWTNSVEVNLALTQTLISMVMCVEVRLDGWITLEPASYMYDEKVPGAPKLWHVYLDHEESSAFKSMETLSQVPLWPKDDKIPALYSILQDLAVELGLVKEKVPSLDTLISGRKNMLQATPSALQIYMDASEPPSRAPSPIPGKFLDVPGSHQPPSRPQSRASSRNRLASASRDHSVDSRASSPGLLRPSDPETGASTVAQSIFQPPPPETPSTTDMLMQTIKFPLVGSRDAALDAKPDNARPEERPAERSASLNHILTNVVVLQEFVLELAAAIQGRAALLGEREIKLV